jgi:hypothetical protein
LIAVLRRHSAQAESIWAHRAMRAMGGVLVGLALWNVVALVGGR